MTKRHRRRFTDEFKAETVKLVLEGDRTVGAVARELDLTSTTVRDWVKRAEVSGSTNRPALDERAELRRDGCVPLLVDFRRSFRVNELNLIHSA